MKKRQKFWIFLLFTILTISLASCSLINSDFDYFSDYSDVNLINSQPLSDWSTTRDTENYMGYEEVDTSITSTDGLSDENLTIYRLENKNLVPSGDFEGISTLAAAGWVESGGDNSIISSGHNLDNNALRFDLVRGYYISYDLNQLSDGAVVNSTYCFHFSFQGDTTGAYYFETADGSGSASTVSYQPSTNTSTVNTKINVPKDTSEVESTTFLIHTADQDFFRINSANSGSGTTKAGYFDNFRVIRSDEAQYAFLNVPYEDSERTNSLKLLSGTYRFGVYVKADPTVDSTNNRFTANGVSLMMNSIDVNSTGLTYTKTSNFLSEDNSDFESWTCIYIDLFMQIDEPEDDSTEGVIKISISPTDTSGLDTTMDAGSVLISNPFLIFSESGNF